jgi:hypothetical protein
MKHLKTTSALLAALLLTCLTVGSLRAQGRHELMIGTQVPIQFTAGYQYNASDRFAIRGQFGLLTPPYNKVILRSMEAFGFDKKLSRAVDEAFRQGLVGTLAPQLRFGSHSVVLQGQYVSLNGSITLQRAAALYLDRELPDLSGIPFLPVATPTLNTRSNLFLLGLGYGWRISPPDSRVSVQLEAGFSKILGSSNKFSSNIGVLDRTGLVQGVYGQMDNRLKDSYRDYGYVPSLSVYLVYALDGGR